MATHPTDRGDVWGARLGPLDDLRPAEPAPPRRSASLTARERAVLTRLAEGRATSEVAELLHLSPHTVRSRVKVILRKLDARNREHAIAIALREGAINPDV